MSRFLKSIIFSCMALSLAVSAEAQGIPGIGTPLVLIAQPESPRPGETVSFSLQSNSLNLDTSSVTWTLDGKIVASGKGVTSASIAAGKLGSIKQLSVVVTTSDGEEFNESIAIRPSDLTLLWQAATYVPPFYSGKALHAFGGTYKVVAFADITDSSGKRIDPRNLVYTWRKNDAIEKNASGYGKNSYVGTETGIIRSGDDISVEVSVPADGFAVSKNIIIASTPAEILFYEDSPLYGTLYEKELGPTENLTNEEITVTAEPYYFSTKSKASTLLRYSWTLNDEPVAAFDNKSSATLRRSGPEAGLSELGLSIENMAKLLQSANRELLISYE